MAIKLQSTLVEEFSYISLHDEAIDSSGDADEFAAEWKRYRDGQRPQPPLKDGAEPTVFHLKPIVSARLKAMLDGVRAEHGQAAWALATAAAAIQSIDGLGIKLSFTRREGYRFLDEATLDQIGAAVLHEIGMVVITHDSPS